MQERAANVIPIDLAIKLLRSGGLTKEVTQRLKVRRPDNKVQSLYMWGAELIEEDCCGFMELGPED